VFSDSEDDYVSRKDRTDNKLQVPMDKETMIDIDNFLQKIKKLVKIHNRKKSRYYLKHIVKDNIKEIHKKIRLLAHRRPNAQTKENISFKHKEYK